MYRYIIILLFLFPPQLHADDKHDKAIKLMQIKGVDEAWSQKIEEGKLQIIKYAEETLNKYTAHLDPNEEYINKFKSTTYTFLSKVENSVTAQEMVLATAAYYASEFTDKELDKLILFYSSPLGKKEARVTDTAIPKLKTHLYSITEPVIGSATKDFVAELALLVKSCNCDM